MKFDMKTADAALAVPGNDRLDAALVAVETADLQATRRRDLASAVRRVAAAIGREPRDIPADPVWLRPKLRRIEPAALGVSRKTWTNILSDFRAALTLAGVSSGRRGRGRTIPLPPDWGALRDALPTRRHRIGLSRLMQFSANLGLGPADVDDATLAAFGAALERSEIRKDPATQVREAATLWNQASEAVAGWPPVRLTAPDRRNHVVLPLESFTPSFRADVEAYLSRLGGFDLLDPDAPVHRLAPETVVNHRRLIRRFASAVVRAGRPPETLCSLADLIDPATVRVGLRFFLARNGGKPAGHLAGLVAVLRAVARWHVRADPGTLESLAGIGRKVAARGSGLTPKNRSRLRQFDDEAAIGALLRLPDRLVARAAGRRAPAAAARDVEIALAIALLIHCPMRIENLRTLDLARHVLGRPCGARRIVIPAAEVKNNVELDFPLPPRVAALLDRYVRDHRRTLNPEPGDLLFAQRGAAQPVAGGYLGERISRAIARETGLVVNPHLFRHIGAKVYLRADPGAYEIVRRLLGHSRTSSTIDSYAGFETDAATQAYAGILDEVAARAAAPRRRVRS